MRDSNNIILIIFIIFSSIRDNHRVCSLKLSSLQRLVDIEETLYVKIIKYIVLLPSLPYKHKLFRRH